MYIWQGLKGILTKYTQSRLIIKPFLILACLLLDWWKENVQNVGIYFHPVQPSMVTTRAALCSRLCA